MHLSKMLPAAASLAALVSLGTAIPTASMAASRNLPAQDAPLDTLVFGDTVSETSHAVTASGSDVVTGGLGLPARRLLPQSPVSYEGGKLTFSLAVDGARRNYVTFKFWGSDHGEKSGRLILFCDGKQVGYRDQGDYDVVNQSDEVGLYPGRFVYITLPLPETLTRGRDRVTLTLDSLGPMWPYGTSFAQYQKPLAEPTRGIYAVYTHTDPHFTPPAGEVQGVPPAAPVRTTPGPETMDAVRTRVNDYLKPYAAAPTKIGPGDLRAHNNPLLLLSEAYTTPWTSVYHSREALDRMVREGDAFAQEQSANPDFVASDWQGAGALGEALLRIYPDLESAKRLDETTTLSGGKTAIRREAWADVLRASVDYWRTHRRFYTNQSMIVDRNIYTANEGLRLLAPERALPKEQVLHYLYEAAGIEPWRGSDPEAQPGGGGADLPAGGYSHDPYGSRYHLVTRKGLSRELGYVGTYGETILHFMSDMIRLTDDPKLRDQLAKLEAARANFRYPLPDTGGNRAMFVESITDNRTAHYPSVIAYTTADVREAEPMEIAALTRDPKAIGIAQQCLADNQYFPLLQSRLKEPDPLIVLGLLHAVNDYETVKSLPPSPYRLPMTDGQPDFVWADEEDAVLALKHGDQKLFVNFYYRSERGINGVVRIHDLTPRIERIVTAKSDFQYVPSGREYTRPDWIDGIRSVGYPPPGETIHQAWAGEKLPIAARPDGAPLPKYGDWGPFVGKASFYSIRYGDYLIGMNCSEDKTYTLAVPVGKKTLPDLVSGKKIATGGGSARVAPLSTVVLWLGR